MLESYKQIILMRHAEAEGENNKGDFFRNLTKKGCEQAQEATKFLVNYKIDKALVSPASRIRQTLKIIESRVKINNIEIIDQIYNGLLEDILKIIENQDDSLSTLLIIGHNPTIYSLALNLTENNAQAHIELLNFSMEPATIIALSAPHLSNWRQFILHSWSVLTIS